MGAKRRRQLQRKAKRLKLAATGTEKQLEARIKRYEEKQAAKKKRDRRRKAPAKKRAGYRYRPRYNKYYRRRRSSGWTEDDRAEMLYFCGDLCFADNELRYPICPKCHEDYCECWPKCDAILKAYKAGHDKDRMLYYGDALDCDWARRAKRGRDDYGVEDLSDSFSPRWKTPEESRAWESAKSKDRTLREIADVWYLRERTRTKIDGKVRVLHRHLFAKVVRERSNGNLVLEPLRTYQYGLEELASNDLAIIALLEDKRTQKYQLGVMPTEEKGEWIKSRWNAGKPIEITKTGWSPVLKHTFKRYVPHVQYEDDYTREKLLRMLEKEIIEAGLTTLDETLTVGSTRRTKKTTRTKMEKATPRPTRTKTRTRKTTRSEAPDFRKGMVVAMLKTPGASSEWEFAEVVRITDSGRIRLQPLNKVTVGPQVYINTLSWKQQVAPSDEQSGAKAFLVPEWEMKYWKPYDENKEYVDTIDMS